MVPSQKVGMILQGVCVPHFPGACPGITSLLPVLSSEWCMFPLGCLTDLLVPCRSAEHLKCCFTSLCGQLPTSTELRHHAHVKTQVTKDT